MIISKTRDKSIGNSTRSKKKMQSGPLVPAKIKLAKLYINKNNP